MPITSPPSSGGEIGSIPDNSIGNLKIASDAAIAWSKISKSGAAAADVGAAASNNPTITGTVTTSGNRVAVMSVMGGTVIDVTKMDNYYAATGPATLTTSATPPTDSIFSVTVATDGTQRVIGFPTAYSSARGTDISDATFPANSINTLYFRKTSTGYRVLGDPLTPAQEKSRLAITAADIVDFIAVARAQIIATLIQGTGMTLTAGGSGASATLTLDAAAAAGDITAAAAFGEDGRVIVSDGVLKAVKASILSVLADGFKVLADNVPGSVTLSDAHATAPKEITITAPATIVSNYRLVLPASPPTAGQVLRVNSVAGEVINLEYYTP